MNSVVYTKIPRPDAKLIEALKAYTVADLHEAMGAIDGRQHLMTRSMRPITGGQRIVGPAVTSYNYPGDNLMIHAALNVAERGDVLVLVNGGIAQGALWGDVAATFAIEKGIEGIVVDGPARDIAALREMNCQVWSTIVSPSHPEKRGPGSVNIPVVCDGVRIVPGDLIVADDDGVLVIPPHLAEGTLERAAARSRAEAGYREKIKAGQSLFEILQMQKYLDTAGITVIEGSWQDAQEA